MYIFSILTQHIFNHFLAVYVPSRVSSFSVEQWLGCLLHTNVLWYFYANKYRIFTLLLLFKLWFRGPTKRRDRSVPWLAQLWYNIQTHIASPPDFRSTNWGETEQIVHSAHGRAFENERGRFSLYTQYSTSVWVHASTSGLFTFLKTGLSCS